MYHVEFAGGGSKYLCGDMIEVNTKNILFIAGGAYVGLKFRS